MADAVLVEQRDRILIITINRPAARNAIDAAVTTGIAAAMDDLDGRTDLSIGILTGAGGTFCAGMDLKAFLRGENVIAARPGARRADRGAAEEAADRRGRGLRAGRRVRTGAQLRPGGRRG